MTNASKDFLVSRNVCVKKFQVDPVALHVVLLRGPLRRIRKHRPQAPQREFERLAVRAGGLGSAEKYGRVAVDRMVSAQALTSRMPLEGPREDRAGGEFCRCRLRRGMSAYVVDAMNPLRLDEVVRRAAVRASSSSSVGRDVSVIRLAASTVGVSVAAFLTR